MGRNLDNYYYTEHYRSSTVSFTNIFHTLNEVFADLRYREESDKLDDVEITIRQKYGWDEQERKELARLKAKYEPEAQS